MKQCNSRHLFALWVICCIFTVEVHAFTPVSELQALLSLHTSAFDTVVWEDETTSGRIWDFVSEDITSENFNQTNPCGGSDGEVWQGIKCSESPQDCQDNSTTLCNVISLDMESFNLTGPVTHDLEHLSMLTKLTLGDNNMYGTIPPTLGNLTNLKVLKLHTNNLYGTIPSSIGQLLALTVFYLDSNSLSSSIPAELGQLSNLVKVFLYHNQLSGSLSEALFDNLIQLTSLLLFENKLTSTIPSSITKVTKLKVFHINENKISGPIAPTWESLSGKLQVFSAKDNLLSGSIPLEIGSLTKLQKLDLGQNNLNSQLPVGISKLTKLVDLNLANNNFNGTIPAEFSRLTRLTSLHVKYNGLTGTIPPELCECVSLQELDLQDNFLTGTIPSELGALSDLLEFDVVNNTLTGSIPREISLMTKLTMLSMGFNRLNSSLPSEISNCGDLIQLKISGNFQMGGTIPDEYGMLSNLRTLLLFDGGFTGTIPRSFGNLSNLDMLLLYSNSLRGAIPGEIGRLSKMQRLSLNGNSLSSSIPYEFAENLHGLTLLTLHDNNLTGSIPQSFENFIQMNWMYLYRNDFTGSIPPSMMSKWTELYQLDLNGNQFSGTVPAEVGLLTNLRFMRFGFNRFTGNIPDSLSKLKELVLVEFQNNLLEGEIPAGVIGSEFIYFCHVENNFLTGTLPPFTGNSSRLASMKFFNNFITGTIPPSYGYLDNMRNFILNYNHLTGTIPVELARLEKLSVLSVKFNYLTGSLARELCDLTSLESLILGSNRFTGTLDLIFQNVNNMTKLSQLDFSDNQFSGTISPSIFQLPLSVLALSINCFDGELPQSMCAAANTLSVLSADGVGSSSQCTGFFKTPFFGITLFNGLGGSIPPCLFEFDNLEVLHLSGNGLVGTLSDISNVSSIYDLAVTHNRIRGRIPISIQQNSFDYLDLSYNDLSGTYTEGNGTSTSEILLEVNRLSGDLDSSGVLDVSLLKVLKGNYFSCKEVPENDEYFDDFSCGSSDLDNSLYFLCVAIFIAACLFVWFAILYQGRTGRSSDVEESDYFSRVNVMTQNFSYYLTFVSKKSPTRKSGNVSLDKITAFCEDLGLITKCIWSLTVASFVLFLPVYLLKIVNSDHSTHEHQYTYLISVTYMTGQVSAALVICAWAIFLLLFSGIAYILNRANNSASNLQSRRRNISVSDPSRKRGLTVSQKIEQPFKHHHKRRSTLKRDDSVSNDGLSSSELTNSAQGAATSKEGRFKRASSSAVFYQTGDYREDDTELLIDIVKSVIIVLVNLLIVGAVNSWYLHYTLGDVSPTERLVVQMSMALFKAGFAVGAVPVLASSVTNTERNILLRLLMAIFNTLLIPLAVTAFTSSSCLESAFIEAPPIWTSYQYETCSDDYLHISPIDSSFHVTCGYYDDEFHMIDIDLEPFVPPFTYSYQCASVLLTSYIPVLIFVSAFQMLLPFGFVWFQIMVNYSTIPAPLRFAFYGVIWPDYWLATYSENEEDLAREATDILVLDTNDIVYADILNQLIVLLSFGLCSPMLAASVSLAFGFKMLMWRMLLGRFVHYRMRLANLNRAKVDGEDAIVIEYDVKLDDMAIDALADATVDFVSVFEMCLWPLCLSSAAFFVIICWDIAGDEVGSKGSLWVPVVVGCIPFAYWLSFVFYKKWTEKRSNHISMSIARQRPLRSFTKTTLPGEQAKDVEMIDVVENPINIHVLKNNIMSPSSDNNESY